jgi:hypothetical protein
MSDDQLRDLSRREFVQGTVTGLALAAAPAAVLAAAQPRDADKAAVSGAGRALAHVFTDAPLKLSAGHYGLGYGTGAHAPDEYYVIESSNPEVAGLDGAIASFVEYLYALAWRLHLPAPRQRIHLGTMIGGRA